MQDKPVFKVIFVNQDEVFEVFAAKIFQSELWGFIEIEEFLFGERSQLLVDPSEEKLKSEFAGVNLAEEAANLLKYQQAYQASARILQTARELFQTLIEVV